ncbi:hypothetical protein PIB30_099195, partial [Stylosanthes scabra]|nr:hypothetical protein [Stylosanthes scabra]
MTITGKRQDEENKAQLHEPGSVHGNVTGGFEPVSAGEWSELVGAVMLQRPPPEPPDLVLLVKLTDARRLRSMENDGGQDVGSRDAKYAEYGVVKEEKQRRTVTTLVNGAATAEGGSASVTGGVSDYVGVLHGNAVAKEEGVTDLLEGGDNLQLGGDRGISNDTEINDVARKNSDITVNEGDGWGQSGSKDDYSSGADPSLLLTVTPIVSSFAGSSVFATRGANASRLNRIQPFLGRPPKLLAAVLPWNRHSPGTESDDNEGGMPDIRKHEEQIEPDLKSYAVALGEPKTAAFMTEATPQWANGMRDVAGVWFSAVWSKFHSCFEMEVENEERKSRVVLLSTWTNDGVPWRPCLSWVGQWQAQIYPFRVNNFLFLMDHNSVGIFYE